MTEDVRALVRLSAALSGTLSRKDNHVIAGLLDEAADCAGNVAVEEVLLQSHLFLGYPVALNALALWRRSGDRPAPPGSSEDPAEWADRGASVCRVVYAGQYRQLRENVRVLHPDMDRWMVTHGYGRVMGRPGLPLQTRELCAVAMLFGLPAERQLHSHLRGALNAGVDAGDVETTLELAAEILDADFTGAAAEVWHRVKAGRDDRAAGEPREEESGVH